jgi:hypothetical protein
MAGLKVQGITSSCYTNGFACVKNRHLVLFSVERSILKLHSIRDSQIDQKYNQTD